MIIARSDIYIEFSISDSDVIAYHIISLDSSNMIRYDSRQDQWYKDRSWRGIGIGRRKVDVFDIWYLL